MQHQDDSAEAVLQEERVFRPLPEVVLQANISPQGLKNSTELARQDFWAYWEEAAAELEWYQKWDSVLDESMAPFYKWFSGARCNIVHNALDRHIQNANKNKLALLWEGEPGDCRKLTYFELYREVNRFANALRNLGLGKGDRVMICMPLLPETVIAMLATAKIGAVHSLVFVGYSAKFLRERIADSQAKCVITADGFYRNGKIVQLKSLVDEALDSTASSSVDLAVIVRRVGLDLQMATARDVWYDDLVRVQDSEAYTESMDSQDMLFLHYTAGTTGRPKGIIHTHGGYMVGVHRTMNWVFDIKATDIYWCTADIGWITGHSYVVYGPLLNGATTVMYEGHPLYPQADRMWQIVARHGVNIFYTTPTLIRMVKRYGSQFSKQHDLSSLRLLSSVGETLNPETWMWFHKYIGRGQCPLLDTWWQTETGMIMISALPISPLKPGSVSRPLPGVEADVVDKEGNSKPINENGYLVIKKPWPAMLADLYDESVEYLKTYWETIPGFYWTGDIARKDEDGYFWIQGRMDDMLNIAGHRIGVTELENAFVSHKAVSEAAVIGIADKIKGEVAKAFLVLEEGVNEDDSLVDELKDYIRQEVGPIAVVSQICFKEKLPKTRSGKIMHRILKAEEYGCDPGDISTMDDLGELRKLPF